MNFQELNELDFEDIGSWPLPVKVFFVAVVAVLIAVGGYYYLIADSIQALDVPSKKRFN